MKIKKNDFVCVDWIDAFSVDPWTPAEEISEADPCLIVSVGIVVSIDKLNLVLALNIDPAADTVSCVMNIPRGMVKKIRRLK